jgi:hypothetical protein
LLLINSKTRPLKNSIFKFLIIIVLSLFCAILLWSTSRPSFYPVKVSIEMKNEKNDLCQLFYDYGHGFKRDQIISKHYWGSKKFRTITFNLPPKEIINIRIDPGISSEIYIIKQIKIEVGKQSETYIGDEILDHFKLFNLTQSDSANIDYLSLKQINSPDAQLIYKYQLSKNFLLVNHEDKGNALFIIIFTFFAVVLTIIFVGNRLVRTIRSKLYKLNLSESQKEHLRWSVISISAVTPFLIPLYKMAHTTLFLDWGYFNGLSLVIRSSVLHYGTFPIHNPWLMGGIDILANPQSRIFSPFLVFDLIFIPPYANLFALITLAIVGSLGFFRLIRYLNISKNIAVIGSILFIHASWFSLHFSVGHIIFGSFQLIGLAFYFMLRIHEKNFKIYYALLNAFFLLDGAIYAFLFTNLLFVTSILFCVNGLNPYRIAKSVILQWKTSLLSILIFLSISSVKIVPYLIVHSSGQPKEESLVLSLKYILHGFFNPFQTPNTVIGDTGAFLPPFQEVGAYLGLVGVFIIISFLIMVKSRMYFSYLLIGLFFFWLGSGWLFEINPWRLFQQIPLINSAHVPSRTFLFTYMMYLILLCFALDFFAYKLKPALFKIIIVFLIAESFFVSAYPYYNVFKKDLFLCETELFRNLIVSNTIDKTVAKSSENYGSGKDFLLYLEKNTGSKSTYEPIASKGRIRSLDDADYKGEVYIINGKGKVLMDSYTPGKIRLNYDLDTISEIQINTNYLAGWKSSDTELLIFKRNGLLTVKPGNLNGIIMLNYQPDYLFLIIPLFFFGLILSMSISLKMIISAIKSKLTIGNNP